MGTDVVEKIRDPPNTVAKRGATQLAGRVEGVPPPAETKPMQGFAEPVTMAFPAASAMYTERMLVVDIAVAPSEIGLLAVPNVSTNMAARGHADAVV